MLKPNFRFRVQMHQATDPLVCSRLYAEQSLSQYIKILIADDMYCPEILRFEHDNKKPMSEDTSDVNSTVRFYYGKDDELIAHLKSQNNQTGYVRDLIYWDMGIDPRSIHPERKTQRHGVNRRKSHMRFLSLE